LKIQLLKNLDKTVGALMATFLKAPHARPLPLPKKILVIRPGGIGDAVHLLPTIACLHRAFPAAAIDVLAEKRNAAVFALMPDIAGVFRYDRLPELPRTVRTKYDLVIDTEQWHYLSAVVTRLVGAARSIGYATNGRKKLFTDAVPYSHDDYEVESFFHLLEPLAVSKPAEIRCPYLTVPEAAAKRVESLLAPLAGKDFAVIFPGASIPERRWGWEKFSEVARRLNDRGTFVVIVGGREDVVDGEKIIAGNNGLNLAGKTTLPETAAVIEKAAVLVSGDSGILHIGVALGRPTVSLFGPGIAKKWAPRGPMHIVIDRHLPCSPCTKFGYTPRCPIQARCMGEIAVAEVVAAVEKLLGKSR
jgi:lipopolysaccharide heptosyltransferase II